MLTSFTCCDTDDQDYRHQVVVTWPEETQHARLIRQQTSRAAVTSLEQTTVIIMGITSNGTSI